MTDWQKSTAGELEIIKKKINRIKSLEIKGFPSVGVETLALGFFIE